MPILADTAALFPDDLFESESIDRASRRWLVIYTKSRQEKALARQLLSFEIPFYLPLVPKDNLIRGRRVRSQIPLFPGYVFLFGSDPERVEELTEAVFQDINSLKNEGTTDEYLAKITETHRRSRETNLKENSYWKSQLVRKALGDHVFDSFIKNKQIEWDQYRSQVTGYELKKYLPIL